MKSKKKEFTQAKNVMLMFEYVRCLGLVIEALENLKKQILKDLEK